MPVEITGMAPLLQVFNMPVSLSFYRDILGFELVQDSGQGEQSGWVLLKMENTEIMLNTMFEDHERPAEPDILRYKYHRDTALYFGCPDVRKLYEYLISKGVSVEKPYITGYGYNALSITDPDGYHLCFQWPLKK